MHRFRRLRPLVLTLWLSCLWPGLSVVRADHPVVGLLQKAPGVHAVKVVVESAAGPVIIHIRDWHWVPYEYVLAEGGNASDYLDLLEQVEQVQTEQYSLLKRIIEAGHKDVFGEAVTPDVVRIYPTVCRSLWESRRQRPDDIRELLKTPCVLSVGTPGRLLAEGLIAQVHPTESNASLQLTQPLDADGNLRDVPAEAMERREDDIVRHLLKVPAVATIVLGGGHDLADNVRRLASGKATLVVVTTSAYQRVTQEQPPGQAPDTGNAGVNAAPAATETPSIP